MEMVNADLKRDTLVFLGDYVDRGPHSKEVVDYLLNLCGHGDHVVFLKGNHEEMLEDYLNGTNRSMFVANGGDSTIASYTRAGGKKHDLLPPEHVAFFRRLLTHWVTEDYFFVHAGLRPEVSLEEQGQWDFLWMRDPFICSEFDFGKRVIFGHTPFREPLVMDNKIGIDTGAVYGNKLTCVELPAVRFFSV